jgi:hypothetical protein
MRENERYDEEGRKGLRMQEDVILEEEYEFIELRKGMRYKMQKIRDKKGELCSEPKGRKPCTLV